MERLSAAERRALLADPLDSLDLAAGYRCLAQLVQAGYFDLILTLNVDDTLDESLPRPSPWRRDCDGTETKTPQSQSGQTAG
jgi:hypothetical protein